jgi:hypothetical protein
MIRRHDFNSEWWGENVGILSDSAFFELSTTAQREALGRFAWVEFSDPVSQLPSRRALTEAGFLYADTQIRFRIDMGKVEAGSCARDLKVNSAAECPFEIQEGDPRPFLHERFYILPGATESRISARYRRWASKLIASDPATSFRFLLNGHPQGWFLAHPEKNGLQLTLAMLSAHASVSGRDLYVRALARFAEKGYRLGFASFSVRNSNVLNIYSQLGARFLEPRECWIWTQPKTQCCDRSHLKM